MKCTCLSWVAKERLPHSGRLWNVTGLQPGRSCCSDDQAVQGSPGNLPGRMSWTEEVNLEPDNESAASDVEDISALLDDNLQLPRSDLSGRADRPVPDFDARERVSGNVRLKASETQLKNGRRASCDMRPMDADEDRSLLQFCEQCNMCMMSGVP